MAKFQEFQSAIDEIHARKTESARRLQGIDQSIAFAEMEYNGAELAGDDTKGIQKRIDKLRSDRTEAARSVQAFEVAEKTKAIPGKLRDLADEVLQEARQAITEYQAAYNTAAEQANATKAAYLAIIEKMGAINRQAETASRQAAQAVRYSKTPHAFPGGIVSGLNDQRREGVIYIQRSESEAAYRPGTMLRSDRL
jgi:uncharacterized phage infection (PIP) family protein YhgE